MTYCYILIEDYLQGCRAATQVVGATLNQQYSYDWLVAQAPEFVSRRVEQVIFYS